MKKSIVLIIVSSIFLCACVAPNAGGPDPKNGFESSLRGIGHLVLAPFQIAAGLIEGIASLPFYLSTSIHEINKGLNRAQAEINLDDTYEWAYGKRLTQVPETGETGEVFRRMKHATTFFQKILQKYGVEDYDRYFLTSIDTANSQGYTLFAVIYRPIESIRVFDKYDGIIRRTLTKGDRLFYEPFERDMEGRSLDTVIDWAGIPREYVKTQKSQALLMTLAANSILKHKRSPEYWDIERRWIAGEFHAITENRMKEVRTRMKI